MQGRSSASWDWRKTYLAEKGLACEMEYISEAAT